MPLLLRQRTVLPGFRLAMGWTLLYLGLIVLLPLAALIAKASTVSASVMLGALVSPRALACFRLTLAASLGGASINAVLGFATAWILIRYPFPGKGFVDALIDLPFALPTAVSGIALAALYSEHGLIGRLLAPLGIRVAFSPLGVVLALTFVGLPFVVRAVQPVLADLEPELEEAAATLGAGRWHIFHRVILPATAPALVTGFTLAFARGLGEYGSVIFISGNMPMRTEIVPLLIMSRLEQFDYKGATAVATLALGASFLLLLLVNRLQSWSRARAGGAGA